MRDYLQECYIRLCAERIKEYVIQGSMFHSIQFNGGIIGIKKAIDHLKMLRSNSQIKDINIKTLEKGLAELMLKIN